MKAGRASRTAELVCMGRAIAHGRTPVERFSDPTALALLPEESRARVEKLRAGERVGGRFVEGYFRTQAKLMAVRTVAIDDAVRGARSPQVVILGAGLDGRAWRMRELAGVTVFEVDHPDSQRDKRARAAGLTPVAKDVRFVPVDFERHDLGAELARAGHDPTRPTTWIWEGVVMYLTPEQVDATLAQLARRSATRSRVIVAYHRPAIFLWVVRLFLQRLGEPLRSTSTPAAMAALLARHGFTVVADEDLPHLAEPLAPGLERELRRVAHMRIATADR